MNCFVFCVLDVGYTSSTKWSRPDMSRVACVRSMRCFERSVCLSVVISTSLVLFPRIRHRSVLASSDTSTGDYGHHRCVTKDSVQNRSILYGSTGTHHSVLEPWVRILVLLYQQYNSTGWYRMYCKAVSSCISPSRERTLVYSWSLGKPGEDGPGRTTWTHHRMTDMLG